MKRISAFALSACLILAGCGREGIQSVNSGPYSEEPPPQVEPAVTAATLKCEIWTQRNAKLDLNVSPDAAISVPLTRNLDLSKTYSLSAVIDLSKSPSHTLQVDVQIRAVEYSKLAMDDVTKDLVRVSTEISVVSTTVFGDGPLGANSSGTHEITNLGKNPVVDQSIALGSASAPDPDSLRDYVDCFVETN